jgi:hypothetical protein
MSIAANMIDWSRCPDVEHDAGAWRIKEHGVPLQDILDSFERDEAQLAIARMFRLPVATVRRVLQFGLRAELVAIEARRTGLLSREDGYRFDRLRHQLAAIERRLRKSRLA